MALQLRTGLIDRTIAETAVGAAFGSDGVVGVICVLVCYALIQIFHELGRAIVQVVHIAAKAIAVDAAIAVHGAAGITHCLGPVVAGVVGILTGVPSRIIPFPSPPSRVPSEYMTLRVSAVFPSLVYSGVLQATPKAALGI